MAAQGLQRESPTRRARRLRTRRPTPAAPADPEAVKGAVADAVAELTAHPLWPSVRAVGVGCAGPLDASQGTVGPINIPAWQDFPLVRAA